MRVLVTGASGRIGRAFVEHLPAEADLELLLADLHRPADADGRGDPARRILELDVTDRDACRRACEGVDAVLHLAADPDPAADLLTRLLPLNVLGTVNILDAATIAGVQRVVFASSGQVVLGHERTPVPASAAPHPINDYGAAKAFGEALCASYAARTGLTCIAVRIGAFSSSADRVDESHRSAWLSPRDAAHLLERCLRAPLTGYHVVNGTSANTDGRLDLAGTRRLLGYEPRDDAAAGAG